MDRKCCLIWDLRLALTQKLTLNLKKTKIAEIHAVGWLLQLVYSARIVGVEVRFLVLGY